MRVIVLAPALATVLFLGGCGGTDRRQPVNPAATATVARFIALLSDTSAGTIHYPRGIYSLESEDHHGYYYRAPVKLYQRSFGGLEPRDGGIFLSKQSQRKLRGYVVMPGGVTHVGNLSGANYQFRY